MSEGSILLNSADLLRIAVAAPRLHYLIDRTASRFVSRGATLSPVRGRDPGSPRQGARGGVAVDQQRAVCMPHVIEVRGAVAVGHDGQAGVFAAQPIEAARLLGAVAILRFQCTIEPVAA